MTHHFWRFLLAFTLALAAAASNPVIAEETAHNYYEDAQRYHETGDQKSALIQLKNALKKDNQHVPSLLLSGDIYLVVGNSPAAEFAYGEALLLGADISYTMPRIAEAYLLQNKYDKIIEELSTDQLSGNSKAELLGYRALAQQGLRDQAASQKAIAKSLSINPRSRVANIAKAQMLLEKKQAASGKEVTTMLVKLYPLDARSWNIHGATLSALNLNQEAIAAYSEAAIQNPNFTNARLARAALLAAANRREEAAIDIDYVRSNHPGDPRGAYMKAQLLEHDGEKEAALEQYSACLEILSLAPPEHLSRHVQLTIMGAVSAIKTGEPQRARSYLEAYHGQDRSNLESGRMLAGMLLEDRDANGALSLLKPLLSYFPDDPGLLALNAQALSMLGRHRAAIAVLQTLVESGQSNLDIEAQIAMNQIMAGNIEPGIAGMEKVLSRDNTRVKDTYFLATIYLKNDNYERATVFFERLIVLVPNDPRYLNMLGRSYMYSGELKRSYELLQGAAVNHAGFLPIFVSLAEVETAQGKLMQARDRLAGLSTTYPENGEVMLQQARVERLLENPELARKRAENAILSNADWVEPRKFLVHLLIEMNKHAEAEELARKNSSRNPDSAELKFQLAQVQVAAGKSDKARITYQLMSRRADSDHGLLYRIAQKQTQLGAFSDARNSLSRATRIEPDSLKYRQAYIQTELNLEKYQVAVELATELGKDYPKHSATYVLRAAAYSGLGQKQEAAKQLKDVTEIKPDDRNLLLQYYRALESLGELDLAEKTLTDWLEKSPKDQTVLGAYADLMIARKRWPDAEDLLSTMIGKQPDNPLLLNNLAFVLHEMGRPEAIDIARKAQRIAPKAAHINDTLGWILVGNAQTEEGLLYLREAVSRQSDSPISRYHLAVALHDLGRSSEAVKQLTLALHETGEFEGRTAAAKLLEKIK